MRGSDHNNRLMSRHMQTQGWTSPLPDPAAVPGALDATRVRVEWDTRDTMSRRHYEAVQQKGPTQVTAAMLQTHPTHGAEPFVPSAGRQDARPYAAGSELPYFPDAARPVERPRLPPRTLYAHPFLGDVDQSDHNVPREFRTAVKEENRTRGEDIAVRMAGRTFTNQWLPAIPLEQLAAAEKLRPASDDWRDKYV
jgi:hypothetical protein